VERLKRLGIALLWLLAFAVVGVGVTILLSEIVPAVGAPTWSLARGALEELAGFLLATWLVGRLLNKQSWERMGWRRGGLPARLGRGIALGAAMAALAIGLALVLNRASVRSTPDGALWLGAAPPLVIGLLAAALAEELMFRGYPLRRLAEAIGPAPALVAISLAFAAAHAGNPQVGAIALGNIALAGVWLSVAFFAPGGMPLAWGAHFGWNAGLALLFDAPVSGYALQVPGVAYAPGAHAWVDGGPFGPEGGIVASIALIAGTAVLLGRRASRPAQWLGAAA
jgi:membrane protease YdiL (CAAX protease family)